MEKEYTQQLEKIEAELERWLPGFNASAEVFSAGSNWAEKIFPENARKISDESMNVLLAPVKDMLSRGGKRWRPLLMTLICETLGGGDAALPLSPLIEFSHNATLIHDDIEDDSEERRGKPAIHKIYGVDTAINSGSFLYFLSLACIEAYAGNREQVYKVWGEYMRGLHLGQAIDISWHRNISFIPTIEEYFSMCGQKTGGLARMAAELGAYAAGAPEETARKLGDAAENLGIGFQILDDVKNLTIGIPGKKRGDDFVEGKKSLPVLLFLTRFPEKREDIYYSFHAAKTDGSAAPEIEEMINTLAETGILEEAEKKGHEKIDEARRIFSSREFTGDTVNEKSRILLEGLINLIN